VVIYLTAAHRLRRNGGDIHGRSAKVLVVRLLIALNVVVTALWQLGEHLGEDEWLYVTMDRWFSTGFTRGRLRLMLVFTRFFRSSTVSADPPLHLLA